MTRNKQQNKSKKNKQNRSNQKNHKRNNNNNNSAKKQSQAKPATPVQILDKKEYDYFIQQIGYTENPPISNIESINQIYRIIAPHFGFHDKIPMNTPISPELVTKVRNKINGLYTNIMSEPYYYLMSMRLKKLTNKYGKGAFHFFYKNPTDFINKKHYSIKTSFMWYNLTKTNIARKEWLFSDYFVWLPLKVMNNWGLSGLNIDSSINEMGIKINSSIHYIISQVIFTDWPFNRNMVIETGPYIHPTLNVKTCDKLRKFFKNEKWKKKQFEKKFPDIVEMMKLDKNKNLINWIATNVMDGDGYYDNLNITENSNVIHIWNKYEKQGRKLCYILFSKRLLRFIKDENCNNYQYTERIINICNNNKFLWKVIGLIIDNDIRSKQFRKLNDLEKFLMIFERINYFPDLDIVFEEIAKIVGFEVYTKIAMYPTTDIYVKAMAMQQRIFGIVCGNKGCNKKQSENGDKFKICSQCQCVWYCSEFCHKKNWSEHRYICQ